MKKEFNTQMLFENAHLDAVLMKSTLFLSCFDENFFQKKETYQIHCLKILLQKTIEKASLHQLQALEADQTETLKLQEIKIYKIITVHVFFFYQKNIYIQEVCKSIFAWNSAQYVEAEQNKYYEGKKGRNYISRQGCFVNRFTLQGFDICHGVLYVVDTCDFSVKIIRNLSSQVHALRCVNVADSDHLKKNLFSPHNIYIYLYIYIYICAVRNIYGTILTQRGKLERRSVPSFEKMLRLQGYCISGQ